MLIWVDVWIQERAQQVMWRYINQLDVQVIKECFSLNHRSRVYGYCTSSQRAYMVEELSIRIECIRRTVYCIVTTRVQFTWQSVLLKSVLLVKLEIGT